MTRSAILFACVVAIAASATLSAQRWGRARLPQDGVCFYKDTDFHDDYFCLAGGDTLASMPEDMNDKISSIRVFGGADVTVFKDAQFAGGLTRFAGDFRYMKG